MKIAFDMGKQAALARGEDRYGTMVVDIPAAELTPEERAELAHWAEVRNGVVADYDLYRAEAGEQFLYAPDAEEPGPTGVHLLLAHCGELRTALLAQQAQVAAAIRARADAAIEDALAKGRDARETVRFGFDGRRTRRLGQWEHGGEDEIVLAVDAPRVPHPGQDDINRATRGVRERYRTARGVADAEAERLIEAQRPELERLYTETKAAQAQRDAEEGAVKAKAAQEREAGLGEWLATHATANQRERHEAGLLPDKEIEQAMTDVAFSSVDLPRYDKLASADVPHGEGCYEPGSQFDAEDASELTAKQWTALQVIMGAAPGGAEVRPRVHNGWCHNCERGGIATRYGVLVVTRRFGRRLVREYALPGGEPD